MTSMRNFIVLLCALIPIWIVLGQDYTPSVFARDDGLIPVSTYDPSFDPWSQLRDPENDPDREPGPFYPADYATLGSSLFLVYLSPLMLKI